MTFLNNLFLEMIRYNMICNRCLGSALDSVADEARERRTIESHGKNQELSASMDGQPIRGG